MGSQVRPQRRLQLDEQVHLQVLPVPLDCLDGSRPGGRHLLFGSVRPGL